MGAAFLITLREGLEAVLIVAIVLAYLQQLGRREQFGWVLGGALAGATIALLVGVAVYLTVGELTGRAEQLTEGSIALAAAGVLTWMIFWMRRQARTIGGHLRDQVDRALAAGALLGLASITFIGVLREGIETALFMLAVVFNAGTKSTAAGGFVGLAGAIALGVLIYHGSQRVNLRLFFQITGGLIIIVAAGLLGRGIHALQEAGAIGTLFAPVWDVQSNAVVGHGHVANFLQSLFGWNAAPSLEQLLAWAAYVPLAAWLFYFDGRLPVALMSRWRAALSRFRGPVLAVEPESSAGASQIEP